MENTNISTLRIELLGEFCVSYDGKPVHFSTWESESTCAFLILNGRRSFNRKRVLSVLFPDLSTECAQKRLRNDIWRIKSAFEASGLEIGSYFQISNRDIGFLPTANVWVDIEEFEKDLTFFSDEAQVNDSVRLIEKVGLYRGDLLEGFDQEWCVWEKERIKMQYLNSLELLMESRSQDNDWQRAIEVGKQLVLHDPLREHVHRQLMRFFYSLGNRPAAIKQYIDCRDQLAIELNVEPMQATRDLFFAIEKETLPRVVRDRSPETIRAFTTQIDEIYKKINEIRLLANDINQSSEQFGDSFKI